ncbi:hypothetical protein KZO25_11790 [Halomonas sp. ANAO-440]|uniref:hypothetical protein n=1 Tax=Halomonas sp. ANAO-440 TaxID=2861360 RepID=UPI001CAA73CF|nr:hypothetical protein [Halomonas sp. ANAO-440]MBZ0330997.1 hypothetical protein [Halomonas sp. ANAO-440]
MQSKNYGMYHYDTARDTSDDHPVISEGERVIGNHSGYPYSGSENFEHDDTGCILNYSGVEDIIFSSFAENNNWEEGYDY